jgi:hypothetical protein
MKTILNRRKTQNRVRRARNALSQAQENGKAKAADAEATKVRFEADGKGLCKNKVVK